ncbi:MAG: hypothetical protein MJY78_00280 [Fibrobacter sp.]|nr:hypothetical protein [Fibrobacter sp.]
MKKILIAAALCFVLESCSSSDSDSSNPSAAPTNTPSNPASSASTPSVPTSAGTNTPANNTTLYDIVVGGVCQLVTPTSSTTAANTGCQTDAIASVIAVFECDTEAMHFREFDNLTIDQVINYLSSNLKFGEAEMSAIYNQITKCPEAFFIYNATSGTNFLYVEKVGDGSGLQKKGKTSKLEDVFAEDFKYISNFGMFSLQ